MIISILLEVQLLLLVVVEVGVVVVVFHTIIHWWSFTGVRVTASLLRSPGLFWVFYPILIRLNGLDSSSDLNFFLSSFKSFGDRSKCTNSNWYHCQPHVSQIFFFFSSQTISKYLSILRLSISFDLWSTETLKSTWWQIHFFSLVN